ncbi:hypothetical protein GCM10010326_46020 [Streptomyces xanthochromogenes]|uniref:Secreted protein n=1 Tax=Streptomyces xanthochromogenes TaxID=67384 RepID=A0ABQ3AF31_9ACTN|nr:hypothetical protein GCM10010326_46020 [Streptomyces xanthochromogenes]
MRGLAAAAASVGLGVTYRGAGNCASNHARTAAEQNQAPPALEERGAWGLCPQEGRGGTAPEGSPRYRVSVRGGTLGP